VLVRSDSFQGRPGKMIRVDESDPVGGKTRGLHTLILERDMSGRRTEIREFERCGTHAPVNAHSETTRFAEST